MYDSFDTYFFHHTHLSGCTHVALFGEHARFYRSLTVRLLYLAAKANKPHVQDAASNADSRCLCFTNTGTILWAFLENKFGVIKLENKHFNADLLV